MPAISKYVSPGVYVQEVVQPTAISLSNVPMEACIIGKAPRVRRVTDEVVLRGEQIQETLTVAAISPHTATLSKYSDRKQQNSTLYVDGVDILSRNWWFSTASITGTATGPFAIVAVTNDRLALSLDGKSFVDITLTAGGARTAAQVATDINAALVANINYGTTYSAAASVSSNHVVITSPISSGAGANNSLSDVRLIAPLANDATTTVLGAGFAGTYRVPTIIQVKDQAYKASAVYKIDYVSTDDDQDGLVNTSITKIVKVGATAGVSTFDDPTDYKLSSNQVDWNQDTQATITGPTGPFNTAVNNALKISINGITPLTVTLTVGGAVTAATLATDINTALNASANYGPLYAVTASAVGGALVLTAPSQFRDLPVSQGAASSITFESVTNNAVTTVFGIATASLPYTILGTGIRPGYGLPYFTTYEFTRPTTDYNVPVQVFTPEQLFAYTGPITIDNYTTNDLAIAGQIMFDNDATSIQLIQTNDTNNPGYPTENEIKDSIDAAKLKSAITEVVLLDTRLSTQVYLKNHVEFESSLLEKNYRRGWFGMPRNTVIGDMDTPSSFVYTAQRTLNFSASSPGRGRAILNAPCNISRDLTLEDGSVVNKQLDSTYVAAANAARHTSFLSVADSLLRKEITGFKLDDFQTYLKSENEMLASNGVNVVTFDAGRLILTDPVTTEQGAGGLPSFIEISLGAQKDNCVREITRVLDQNLIGIVPTDISDFIFDIKALVGLTLTSLVSAGSIGTFRDTAGNARDISLRTDVQVFQSKTDPRTFTFRYFFYGRYPAKRLFGEYSVDSPFWSVKSNTISS